MEDCKVNGILVFKGMEIIIFFYVFYYDLDVWENLEKFDFERFEGFVKDICYLY